MTRKSKILLTFFIAALTAMLVAIIFTMVTLQETPLSEVQTVLTRSITTEAEDRSAPVQTRLETGSFVRANEFNIYRLLTLNPMQFVEPDAIKRVPQTSDILAIERDIILDPSHPNDCRENYCIQVRRSFREIPSTLWRGLIGIEDIRFLSHAGFDPRAIMRALVRDVISMGFVEGGSTITQQLAKNLFLTSHKSIFRKLKELIVAVTIEMRFTKDEIIQAYLNEVYWGALQGVRVKGFHAASALYFEKLPRDLSTYEATILISLLKGPNYYHPIRRIERLRQRVDVVTELLKNKKIIDHEEVSWDESQWKKWQARLEKLEDYSERPLMSWWLSSKASPGPMGSYGKYVFISSAQRVLAQAKARAPKADLAVKAIVLNKNEEDLGRVFRFYSKVERDQKVALQDERHQVGSTLKPIIYANLLRLGADLNDVVETGPIQLKLKSGMWSPEESGKVELEFVSIADALKMSLNRPLIRLTQQYGFEEMEQMLEEDFSNLKKPLDQYPAQLLGALELSVEELALAYKKFFTKECGDLATGVIDVLNDPTQTTIKRVVGKVMSQMRFFGKTGTTNAGRDNWFVFYDGAILSVVWVGQETARSGGELPLYGSSTSFKILESYLLYRGKLFSDLQCVINPEADVSSETAI